MFENAFFRRALKHVFLFILTFSSASIANATSIAIEFQENQKFTGIIGKANITENTIEIVTFAENEDKIIPFAWIYRITEKEQRGENTFIKCTNQLGVTSIGFLDLSNVLIPKINIKANNGVTITNLSEDGLKMKKQYLPQVDLGN